MAEAARAAKPLELVGVLSARMAMLGARNIRLTVLVCIVLICGSFAAAAALQMRLDRMHALNQAAVFEARQTSDAALAAAATLERIQGLGELFADGKLGDTLAATAPEIANIAVFAADGTVRTFNESRPIVLMDDAKARAEQGRLILPGGLLAFAHNGAVVAATFDPLLLLPQSMRQHGSINFADGTILAEGIEQSGRRVSAQIPGWPLTVHSAIDEDSALSAWYGTLPLYLFVILGPAIVGAALAFIFVREFERRARASEAVRNLRNMRPVEAKLLVRLADAERNAFEASRSKSEFIAHMSHELRTPLNAVIGFSEVIEQGFYGPAGHPKYVEYARDIANAGRQLHAKIGDILEFSNIEAGRYPLRPETVSLEDIAHACVNEHMGRAFSRRIELQPGFIAPVEARADALAVRRIVSNLVANALTYTDEGGTVRVDVMEDEGAALVRVRDTGTGFSDDESRQAGEAFTRFDRSGAVTGSGLGLAIAVALARRMGGAVKLGGGPGEGTIADLRLPRPDSSAV
jgi:signal transduction histidine kinase